MTALLVFCFYRHKAMKYFGGTTGDLSGYFLCLCEVWIVLVLAVSYGNLQSVRKEDMKMIIGGAFQGKDSSGHEKISGYRMG